MSDTEASPTPQRISRCSFCGKPQTDVKKLIAGPGVHICNECVELCLPLLAETSATPASLLPDTAPTETLLKTLAGYNGAFDSVGVAMQDIVDILRGRTVSWAIIGQTLGVSRQAAWKRFG